MIPLIAVSFYFRLGAWLSRLGELGVHIKRVKDEPPQEKKMGWSFKDKWGQGKLLCAECGYKEPITVYFYNPGEDESISTCWQCLKCGCITTIEDHRKGMSANNNPLNLTCSCGGELSNAHKVFCPVCKSNSVSYKWNGVLINYD